jgi:dipeptidyl-peptidase 4
MAERLTFPRQMARTQRFNLGTPRGFVLAPGGGLIAFLRTKTGTDRATCLWTADPAGGAERLIADPVDLLAGGGGEELTEQERARRERSRQGAAGIVDFATDAAVTKASFMLSGRLFLADLAAGTVRELPAATPVLDPRLSPSGTHVAYVSAGALRVICADGSDDHALAEPENELVSYGVADFIAAEELDRFRGFWWSPDGGELLVARVDESPVDTAYIADPARPRTAPREVRYPAAGTGNALVGLVRLGLDGSRDAVVWDAQAFEYLVSVHWSAAGPALVSVLSRDQRGAQILAVGRDGACTAVHAEQDPAFFEFFPGAPAWVAAAHGGRPALARIAVDEAADTYRLYLDDKAVTPPGLQVRSLVSVSEEHAYVTASPQDPTRTHVYRVSLPDGAVEQISSADGVNSAAVSGDLAVIVAATLDQPGRRASLVSLQGEPRQIGTIATVAETPVLTARPIELVLGERGLRAALLLPTGYTHTPGTKLPVLLDPYGGPHAQMVVGAHNAHLESQWFADQGFAVLVADGRGTPGRGPAWDRSVSRNIGEITLQDQVDALAAAAAHAAAEGIAEFDLGKVAMRGWSYGGYLSARAVLARPDVFHAAVVGAPVTDWQLYDTAYTERYLGHPDTEPEAYRASSLLGGAQPAQEPGAWAWALPARPMMVIHGLADDNVVVAHSLRLSSALVAAGRPHEVLPLSGVTHMTPQEVIAENLLLFQVDFLRRSLGLSG